MRRILIPFGIIAILIMGAYLILSFYAVKLIEPQVQKAMGPGFTIAQIKVGITCLSIHHIRFEDPRTKQTFLRIEEIKIYPDLFSFLKRRMQIRECVIIKPSLLFSLTREGDLIGPWVGIKKEEKRGEVGGKEEKKESEAIPLKVDVLRFEKGSIDFEDRKTGETPCQIRLSEVNLKMERIDYPIFSARSPVELRGKMKGRVKEGEIITKGWIDLRASELEATLKIRDIELRFFEPYYRKRVTAEIISGQLNMDGRISVQKGVLDAAGKMELVDLQMREEGTVFYIPAKTLYARLKDKGNRVEVPFHVKGNLNDSGFKLQDVFLLRIGIGLAQAMGFPVKAVDGVDKEKIN